MAQILFDDKILGLSHSAGVISISAGSVLTIGGQQYTLSSNVQYTLPTLSAMTLYFVYAIVSNGSVSLVQSTNVNSAGPAGASAWKLVGAYYSNGNSSVAFGSFVSIDGSPTTGSIPFVGSGTWTTNTTYTASFKRFGEMMEMQCYITLTGAPGGSAGLLVNTPNGFSMDSSKLPAGTAIDGSDLGKGYYIHLGVAYFSTYGQYSSATQLRVTHGAVSGALVTTTPTTSTAPITFGNGDQLNWTFRFPVVGWDTKPLKDL